MKAIQADLISFVSSQFQGAASVIVLAHRAQYSRTLKLHNFMLTLDWQTMKKTHLL